MNNDSAGRDELLPCPWCGEEGIEIVYDTICCPVQYTAKARCSCCGAEAHEGSGVCNTQEEAAIAAKSEWNDRPSLSRQSAQGAEAILTVSISKYGDYSIGVTGSLLDKLGKGNHALYSMAPDAVPRAELEQYRKDAERYRWLRGGDNDEAVMMVYDGKESRKFDHRFDSAWLPRNEKLDETIDRAMQEGK